MPLYKAQRICDAVRLYSVPIIHHQGDKTGQGSGVEGIADAICSFEKSVRFHGCKGSLACQCSSMGDGVSHLLVKREDGALRLQCTIIAKNLVARRPGTQVATSELAARLAIAMASLAFTFMLLSILICLKGLTSLCYRICALP